MPSDTSHPPSRLGPLVNPPALNERRIWGYNPIIINVKRNTKITKKKLNLDPTSIYSPTAPAPSGEKKMAAGRTDSIESKIIPFPAASWRNMSRNPRPLLPQATAAPGCPRSWRRRTFSSPIGNLSTRSFFRREDEFREALSSGEQQLRDFWHNQHLIQRN